MKRAGVLRDRGPILSLCPSFREDYSSRHLGELRVGGNEKSRDYYVPILIVRLSTMPAVYRLLLLFGEPLTITRTFSCRVFMRPYHRPCERSSRPPPR